MGLFFRPFFSKKAEIVMIAALALVCSCRKLAERPTALAASSHPLATDHATLIFNGSEGSKSTHPGEELSICLNGPFRINAALKTIQIREEGKVFATIVNTEVCDVAVQTLRLDQRKNLISDDIVSLKKKGSKTLTWSVDKSDFLEFSVIERSNCNDKDANNDGSSEMLQYGEQTDLQLGACG